MLIFKRIFPILLLLSLAAYGQAAGGSSRHVVIGFDLDMLKRDAAAEGGLVSYDLSYHHGFVAQLSVAAAQRLQAKHGMFALIEEDGVAEASAKPGSGGSTQPAETRPWGIAAVKSTEFEAFTVTKGAGAKVCVVDTGIEANHPDLSANILAAASRNFVWKRGSLDPAGWNDDNGHGTHVSGTVAALDNEIGVIGVAPQASLIAAKVLDARGSGYLSDVAEGIRHCTTQGAHVINMSLGSTADSTLVRDAVVDAQAAGVILVAAAGNSSADVAGFYPAAYAEVIAVSAVDSAYDIAWFSNFGTKIAFSAPGVGVNSTYKGSAYKVLSGTSMAAPHVSGVAALKVASGSLGLLGDDIGLPATEQGSGGFINALRTVQNQPTP